MTRRFKLSPSTYRTHDPRATHFSKYILRDQPWSWLDFYWKLTLQSLKNGRFSLCLNSWRSTWTDNRLINAPGTTVPVHICSWHFLQISHLHPTHITTQDAHVTLRQSTIKHCPRADTRPIRMISHFEHTILLHKWHVDLGIAVLQPAQCSIT